MTDGRGVVKAQYEAWVYPAPIPDLAEAIGNGMFELSDPSLVRRKLWPRNIEPKALDILVAGCGSSQAAHYAFTNPECRVLGIDISETSLAHQESLKEKHKLGNLELRQLPLEQAAELRRQFDMIVSTGVLHHLPDPDRGLRSLRDVLAPHGVMSIMLYGRHGRLGVYLLQDALRLLRCEQDEDGLDLVRHLLDTLPDWHPVRRYQELAADLGYDAGLVDTFLHKVDRAYTVPDVMRFASDNGLTFQGWLDNLHYSVSAHVPLEDDVVRRRAESLDEIDQWALIELLFQSPGTHRFLVCHADRPPGDYTLDFSGDAWLDYVPTLRPPIEIGLTQRFGSGAVTDDPTAAAVVVKRDWHSIEVNALGAAILELLDAVTPIRRIVRETSPLVTQAGWDRDTHLDAVRDFFRRMAGWDHLQFRIR